MENMENISSLRIGRIGEEYTARYLKKQRFKIKEMNMRNSLSEIDIIAENKNYILFVEVKTRTGSNSNFRPLDAVTNKKMNLIMRSASAYMMRNRVKKQPRFDVAEVFLDIETLKVSEINYIENAYIQGGDYAVF